MANMTFKTNILPNSNLEYNLGSTTKQWNIYGRLFTTSKDIEESDKLIITDGNDYYSSNITFDGDTETQYLTKKGTFASAPVESVAGMNGNVSLYTLSVGEKSYNGSENIVVTMADLGITSAMRFLGVTDTTITDGSTATTVNIVSGGSLGEATPSNGDVVLTQSDQIEYIYTGSEWKELGLTSSYALRHHTHGNILTDGSITSDTAVASGHKLVITDASNKVSRSNISFGTSTTKALSNAGTWIDVNNYTLPTASSSVKGGVKIGSGLTMTGEVLSANVTGIKGNAETNYRTGNVNLTAANIGAAASNHNHDNIYIKKECITVDSTTINSTTGNFIFKGNNLINNQYDWVGFQCDAGNDKFQIMGSADGNPLYRQNDTGSTNAANWTAWKTILTNTNYTTYTDSIYVKKSGDTMTGPLRIKISTTLTYSTTVAPSANVVAGTVYFDDKDGQYIGYVQTSHNTNNNFYNTLGVRRKINSTTVVWAAFNIGINTSGTATYSLSNPAGFRSAIGINWPGNTTTFHRGDGTWTDVTTGKIHIYNSADVASNAASTNAPLLIGSPTGTHVVFDNNEILAKINSTTASILYLGDNVAGSSVQVAAAGGLTVPNSRISVGARTNWNTGAAGVVFQPDGDIHLGHASGGHIIFHYAKASANTAVISETLSGNIRVSNRLTVNADNYTQYINGATGGFNLFVNGAIGTNGEVWTGNTISIRKNYTSTTAYTNCTVGYNEGQWYLQTRIYRGTAATAGWADLLLGNSLTNGTAKKANGRIYLYNKAGACPMIWSDRTTLGGTTRDAIRINYLQASQVWGAVWNDYAEFRQTKEYIEPGRCVYEIGDDTLALTTKRLMRGCEIVSDTYGFAIGENEEAKTPTAASGRVLAYPYENREEFRKHIGWPVCSGPNGTVSIMTEEEEEKYASRIIGTISSVPDYNEWCCGDKEQPEFKKVNGRIWIRIR